MYKKRREKLLQILREKFPDIRKGVIVLFADFENDKHTFLQESSFYYMTGISEPGVVYCLYLDGREKIFIPRYGRKREQWVTSSFLSKDIAVEMLGEPCAGYAIKPFFYKEEYENLIKELDGVAADGKVFTLLDLSNDTYFMPIHRFKNVCMHMTVSFENVIDVSSYVHAMRRGKDESEVEKIKKAIAITNGAHKKVAQNIKNGMYEYEVQAEIEALFTKNKAGIAFPSIVATGKNSTVLHYMARDKKLMDGDLVVVDIGAQYEGYCADITRTYPVSGTFTKRQKEVYTVVLETQKYIQEIAAPDMYLWNNEKLDLSLHHRALEFLKQRGYYQYFVHGIGHFLGLDVHDVGDMRKALKAGDVFTIEPGIYISEENIGVRIEDDFLITNDGCICLSKALSKEPEEIEDLMS